MFWVSHIATEIDGVVRTESLLEILPGDHRYNASWISLQPAGKAGRNEACPCGSGKKFKKCCR